jgi:dynein light chain LC8-type
MDWDDSGEEETAQIDAEDMQSIRIRQTNLAPDLKTKALKIVIEANARNKMDKDMASDIKSNVDQEADLNVGPGAWQIIVGKSFGLSITHETKLLLFLDIITNKRSVMMFRTQ